MLDYDLTHPLVLGVFTAAVSTAAIMGWLTISNVLTWRAMKARELAVYASFTGGGAALAAAVAATFVPMGDSARILVFRLVWAFSCGALGAWMRAIPRFVGVRSVAADRVGVALYGAVAIPLLDIVAGALGQPFFLLPGPRESSSILVAAAGNTYHHSALADAVGGVLAITTIIGAGLLLKAISDSGRSERVLTIGIVLTVVAGIAETGMAVTDARFMAPLIFAAYLVEAMRITFSSNRSVAESLAESRQAQASQRALIAEQLDRLAAAQRLAEVGSETARLSHDIRNPLAAADVTLELVQELADDISQDRKDEIVELVGLTRDALGTGLALVNRITERARLPE